MFHEKETHMDEAGKIEAAVAEVEAAPSAGGLEKPDPEQDKTKPAKTKPKASSKVKVSRQQASGIRKAAKVPAKPAAAPWTFPKNTLEDAIKIARAIEEQNAGNPMKPDILAKAVGYNSVADWRFLDLLRSAKQYGLVDESGKISPVALTNIGQDVVAPSAPSDRPKALMAAFRSVPDFQKVEDFYKGKNLLRTNFLKIICLENFLFRASGSRLL
jgi:hypothetical protein